MDMSFYSPSPLAQERLKEVRFVAVVGPTAVGKSTLIHDAKRRDPSLHEVLNNTSRAPRSGEVGGVDFRFETQEAMEQRIERGEYVQVAPTVFGDLYATAADDYPTTGIALLPVLAEAIPQFRNLPFKELRIIYVLPPDWDTWQTRIATHLFTPDKLAGRMREAQRSLAFALKNKDVQFIISRDVAQATDDFLLAISGQPYTAQLQSDQQAAKDIIQGLLARLKALPEVS